MHRSAFVIAAAILLLPGGAAAQSRYPAGQTEQVTRTLAVGDRGEILLSNLSGDIVVTRGGGRDVRVEAVKTARGRTDQDAREMLTLVEVAFVERGTRAEVRSVYPSQRERGERRNVHVSVTYTVTAPEHTRLTLRSLSGDIRVTDIKGEISAVTTSGNVTIRNGERVATARSTSGNVEIIDMRGDMPFQAHSISGNVILRQVRVPRLEATTISGNVRLVDVQTDRVNAQSISGDVDFGSPLATNGRYTLKSHSGNVRITVAGNAGFEIDASTFSGSVRSDVQLQNARAADSSRSRGRALRGIYGDGSALLDVTTFSGNVVVTRK